MWVSRVACVLWTKLDEIGLDYVGAYRNKKEYDTPKIVSLNGKRIGVLAYTYGQNGVCDDFFFDEKTRFYMRPVVSADSKYFKRNVSLVKDDFERLKAEHPDLVIVLPHMGAQFRRQPDTTQRKWCDIFVELGADIIFSDHTHHVQPLEWRKNSFGKNVLIVHCPGNFVNSYVGYNGDASMIVSAYLDRDTLEPVAASVTPVYAHCPQNGMWTGLPVYKAVTDKGIYSTLSRADYRRLAEVHRLVTEVAIDAPLGIDNVQKEYCYFPETGYVRNTPPILENCNDILHESCIVQCISEASSVCFVGDSVTEGTKNGGYGWFEPLAGLFPDKRISRFAKGGETSRWLLQNAETVAYVKAALYVVAIGCNDIRYRNDSVCAMSAEEYVDNIEKFVRVVLIHNPAAKFAFIAPWRSLYFDAYFNVTNHSDRMRLYSDYTQGLESYCHSAGHLFLDPNPWIFDRMTEPVIRTAGQGSVLRDFIHPDAFNGIALYSRAVAACRKIDDN